MKLRKIGNSLGTTFTRDMLASSGFTAEQELDVIASPGQLKIVPASGTGVIVSFTPAEAKALVSGKFDSKSGASALNKVRQSIDVAPDDNKQDPQSE